MRIERRLIPLVVSFDQARVVLEDARYTRKCPQLVRKAFKVIIVKATSARRRDIVTSIATEEWNSYSAVLAVAGNSFQRWYRLFEKANCYVERSEIEDETLGQMARHAKIFEDWQVLEKSRKEVAERRARQKQTPAGQH
jgi:hypothetical protein